ncbi:IclR family transcriptional regulator [Sinomonas halotolerans]|uniref:IclR family transcriptional regulator n=1 Tax=Sinomonas halotolerans TaxID=1644133 RepID=A0ABU9WVS4_9MICC
MAGRPRTSDEAPQGAAASLLNGLGVLEAFSIEKPILGVTEIAQRVGLHKSTVSRILSGLAEAGYVQRDEATGRYRLGLGLLALSGPLLADLDVRRAALPYLEELTDRTGETSALAVWNGEEAIVVEQVPSPHQVKHTASIGTRYKKFASSSVRVFLAGAGREEAMSLLESGAVVLGERSRSAAARELADVRNAGVAVNDGGTTPEEFGVSAPVYDYRNRMVGCVTASAPRSRAQGEAAALLAAAVIETAAAVSARLGAGAKRAPA